MEERMVQLHFRKRRFQGRGGWGETSGQEGNDSVKLPSLSLRQIQDWADPSPFVDHTPVPYLADITRLLSAADTTNDEVVDWMEVRVSH